MLNIVLNLENETGEALNLYGSTEAFNPTAKKGDLEFYPSAEGLPAWIELSEKALNLAPGESKKVSLKISVPAEVAGGSYYAAVFWGTSPPENVSSGAAVGARLGCLIFLNTFAQTYGVIDVRKSFRVRTTICKCGCVCKCKRIAATCATKNFFGVC